MRRKNREVTDKDAILDILWRCDTIRLGMTGENGPYVVPLSFGLDLNGEKPVVYFHCARKGMKVDLLASYKRACVEGDIFGGYEVEAHGITTRFFATPCSGASSSSFSWSPCLPASLTGEKRSSSKGARVKTAKKTALATTIEPVHSISPP